MRASTSSDRRSPQGARQSGDGHRFWPGLCGENAGASLREYKGSATLGRQLAGLYLAWLGHDRHRSEALQTIEKLEALARSDMCQLFPHYPCSYVEPVAARDERTDSFATRSPARDGDSGLHVARAGARAPVDHRSDIFAFGAILYELLSGKRAFRRDTAADTMAAILKEEPPELAAMKPRISPSLDRVVRRCLEKDKSQRFHSVHDVAFALLDTSSAAVVDEPPAPQPPRNHLASAPFWSGAPRSRSSSASRAVYEFGVEHVDHFTRCPSIRQRERGPQRGVLERRNHGLFLSTAFSQLPHLKVMSRDSVAGYKKRDASAQVAGRELKVQAVLKGQFLQHDQDLSITAELVDVRDNTHLWGGRFNRKLSEMQAVQDEIATQISAKLRTGLERRREEAAHKSAIPKIRRRTSCT